MSIPVIKPSVEVATPAERKTTEAYTAWHVMCWDSVNAVWVQLVSCATRKDAVYMAEKSSSHGSPCIVMHIEFPAVPL